MESSTSWRLRADSARGPVDGGKRGNCVVDDLTASGDDEVVTPRAASTKRADARLVAIVAYPEVQALDVTGPFEVFAGANSALDAAQRPGLRYRAELVSIESAPGSVPSESGLSFSVQRSLTQCRSIDTLVVPGGRGVYAIAENPAAVRRVAKAAASARRVATVCTGAFLGAAAGVFPPGTRVATHWAFAPRLASEQPTLEVDADAIHLRSDNVWSSAGVTAGVDLALALVEDDHGTDIAQTVARWLVVFLRRPGGQSQFAAPVWFRAAERPPVRAALSLIHADPSGPLDLRTLAAHAGLSERHFLRTFQHEVGATPSRYVERIRVEAARRLLETDDAGLSAIAKRCGSGTTETLRRTFHRCVGVAPDDYRHRFRTLHREPA
jgi:transcriptional regulator GlxA family with amidase domain